jgi:threonine aldolase
MDMATRTPNRLIDLYSDTQTKPTPGMRKAIAESEVGDEQRNEDPTTLRLQDKVAEITGKEAAVFLPTGTMCNQIAMLVHCRPGDEIIGANFTHIFTSEAGGASALARAQTWPIPTEDGIFSSADVAAAIREPGGRHSPRSRVLVVEQTNNRGGGAVWPVSALADVAATAHKHGLAVHMDGARLPNAAVAAGQSAKSMTASVDSAWIDLTKGLGCPVGAVLAGSKDFIDEAWRWKHRLGGAMRQSGILAAAGLYAIEHQWDRLAEDHANARLLHDRIGDMPGLKALGDSCPTNIVYFSVEGAGLTSKQVQAALLQKNVRMGVSYGTYIRAVTHHDVSRSDIETAISALAETIKELKGKA